MKYDAPPVDVQVKGRVVVPGVLGIVQIHHGSRDVAGPVREEVPLREGQDLATGERRGWL